MKIQQINRESSAFQQPIDEQLLSQALTEQLPEQLITTVTELSAGLFNNTYRVDTQDSRYILKIAPDAQANVYYNERHLMQREQSLADRLSALSPLIPDYHGFFEIDGRAAFLQAFVPGRLWHDEIETLSEDENAILWEQLGSFARKLHDHPGDLFGYPDPFTRHERWSQFIEDNVNGMVADAERLGLMCDEIREYVALLPGFASVLDEIKQPGLMHGDIWPRNVIFDGAGENIHIVAVIDCERAFWGDPISDWVLLFLDLPSTFWRGYGENLKANTDPVRMAVYKGMYYILNIIESERIDEHGGQAPGWLAEVNAELRAFQA